LSVCGADAIMTLSKMTFFAGWWHLMVASKPLQYGK